LTEGVTAKLNSTIPYVSPVAWTSFATGKHPLKHEIFGFVVKEPGTYKFRFVSSMLRDGESFWFLTSKYGKNAFILYVPMFYPPEKVNGYICTDKKILGGEYPQHIARKLRHEGIDRTVMQVSYILGQEDRFLEDLYYVTEMRAKAAKYLMTNYDWDLFIVVFFSGDTLQHYFWKFIDEKHPQYNSSQAKRFSKTILEYYKKLDEIIGELGRAS
jgi:predicted AlkP superfamily phosphohydrolase/phosphomutase